MASKKSRRKATKRKSTSKRRKPVGKACRNANMVVTRRKRDHTKALAKIKSRKKPFVIKDMIHTTSNPRQGRKRYHKKCWDSKYH